MTDQPDNKTGLSDLAKLLIVMAILAVIIGVLLGLWDKSQGIPTLSRCHTSIKIIEVALECYKHDWGNYPVQSKSYKLEYIFFQSLKSKNGECYLPFGDRTEGVINTGNNMKMIDPYGNEFFYKCPGTRNPKSFDLWSTGEDGKHGIEKSYNPEDALNGNDSESDDITNFGK